MVNYGGGLVKDLYDQSMTDYNNNNNKIKTHPKTKQQQLENKQTKPLVLNKDYLIIDGNVRLSDVTNT